MAVLQGQSVSKTKTGGKQKQIKGGGKQIRKQIRKNQGVVGTSMTPLSASLCNSPKDVCDLDPLDSTNGNTIVAYELLTMYNAHFEQAQLEQAQCEQAQREQAQQLQGSSSSTDKPDSTGYTQKAEQNPMDEELMWLRTDELLNNWLDWC